MILQKLESAFNCCILFTFSYSALGIIDYLFVVLNRVYIWKTGSVNILKIRGWQRSFFHMHNMSLFTHSTSPCKKNFYTWCGVMWVYWVSGHVWGRHFKHFINSRVGAERWINFSFDLFWLASKEINLINFSFKRTSEGERFNKEQHNLFSGL